MKKDVITLMLEPSLDSPPSSRFDFIWLACLAFKAQRIQGHRELARLIAAFAFGFDYYPTIKRLKVLPSPPIISSKIFTAWLWGKIGLIALELHLFGDLDNPSHYIVITSYIRGYTAWLNFIDDTFVIQNWADDMDPPFDKTWKGPIPYEHLALHLEHSPKYYADMAKRKAPNFKPRDFEHVRQG